MDQQPDQAPHGEWRDRETRQPCTGCSAEVIADPVDGGLNCATCGQWHVLCGDCMPNVTEYSRDAAWDCPECRNPTYH